MLSGMLLLILSSSACSAQRAMCISHDNYGSEDLPGTCAIDADSAHPQDAWSASGSMTAGTPLMRYGELAKSLAPFPVNAGDACLHSDVGTRQLKAVFNDSAVLDAGSNGTNQKDTGSWPLHTSISIDGPGPVEISPATLRQLLANAQCAGPGTSKSAGTGSHINDNLSATPVILSVQGPRVITIPLLSDCEPLGQRANDLHSTICPPKN